MLAAFMVALAGLALLSPANRRANRSLTALLIVLAGVTLERAFALSPVSRVAAGWVALLPYSVPLAVGPLVYAYVRDLVIDAPWPRRWLHFLPALAAMAHSAWVIALPASQRLLLEDGRGRDRIQTLFDVSTPLSLAVYGALSVVLIARHRRWADQTRSDRDAYRGWGLTFLLGGAAGTLFLVASVRTAALSVPRLDRFDLWVFDALLACVGVALGVEAVRRHERPFPSIDNDASTAPAAPALPAASADRDWSRLGREWAERLASAGWWREPGLSLPSLARRLGTNTSHLSRAFNEGLGQSFPDVVNALRAEEVARRLEEEPGRSDLLTLAFEAGFSSKASFNRAFRARFGVAPSEWRKNRRRTS